MTIPLFPEFHPIELDDQADVERALTDYPVEAAEYPFPNLFAWREFDSSHLTMVNGNLCILSTLYKTGTCCFMQPLGSKEIIATLTQCLHQLAEQKVKDPKIVRVTESFVQHYRLAEHFHCEEDRDNWDYVYAVTELAELKGRKYDGKRNHIAHVRAQGNYTYHPLTTERIPGCMKVLDAWAKNKYLKEDIANLETLIFGEKAIREYLKYFEQLYLFGGVLTKDDMVVAFTIASRLSKDTAVTYVEVSLPDEQGLNQLLNQEFCRNGLKGYTYVNREQDLGHEGLRKAKMSYQPHHFVRKYIVRKK